METVQALNMIAVDPRIRGGRPFILGTTVTVSDIAIAKLHRDFIKRLRSMRFDGPYSGGRHEFMLRGDRRPILPNPHRSVIGVNLLIRLLRQAGIPREEWQQGE